MFLFRQHLRRHLISVSTPGKVLLTGSYLILEPSYSGIVLTTSSRMRIEAQEIPPFSELDAFRFVVRSPDYGVDDEYAFFPAEKRIERVDGSIARPVPAPFVENSLFQCCEHILENVSDSELAISGAEGLLLSVNSHPDFGSEQFKTGLGSSAALTTGLVGSILASKGIVEVPFREEDLGLIMSLAYRAHSISQGMTGSGFDVSACVFGSQVFQRPLQGFASPSPSTQHYERFKGHRFRRLLLSHDPDSAGTSTSGFVGRVCQWRRKQRDVSETLFSELNRVNQAILASWRFLAPKDSFRALGPRFVEVTDLLRRLGQESGCEIVPDVQYERLARLRSDSEIIPCGVMGAGGHDGLWALAYDEEQESSIRESFDLLGMVMLDAEEDHEGIQVEEVFEL